MQLIDFNDSINYSKNNITAYDGYQTKNLANYLYSCDLSNPYVSITATCLSLINVVNSKFQKTVNINEQTFVVINPDIADLFKAFCFHPYKPMPIDETKKLSEHMHYIEKNLISLLEEINDFIITRENIFSGMRFPLIELSETDENKLLNLINQLNLAFLETKTYFNDYVYTIDGTISKCKYSINLNYLYNYETIYDFCKSIASKDNEYFTFEGEKYLIEQEIKELNKIPFLSVEEDERLEVLENKLKTLETLKNTMNDEPLFNKEFFACLALKLEKFIKKEKAINQFVTNILNDNIPSIIVDNNFKINVCREF